MDLSLMIRFIMVIMAMGDGDMSLYESNWFDQSREQNRGHFGSDRYNPATGLYKQYDWETKDEAKLRHQTHLESLYYGYGLWSEGI